jgi:hypothetical protein
MYVLFGTFTGFHRVVTDDNEHDDNNLQTFKDNYVGRILSNEKPATETN